MDKNYYKAYYRLEREHWWFTARAEILRVHLRRVLKGRNHLKILNIGVATGQTSILLQEFGAVTSVEYDADSYAFVRDVVKIPIQQGSILALDFADESFDLVCAFDVIEHVADDKKAVAEMRRVCRQGGILSVTVPAFMFLWSEHDVVNHHFRRYTAPILRGLFSEKNDLIFHSYFNFYLFFPIAAFRIFTHLFKPKPTTPDHLKSDFSIGTNSIVNRLLHAVFKSENLFLKNFIALPWGVSILSTWRKPDIK
jgi:SAM-dependent methyltransferase